MPTTTIIYPNTPFDLSEDDRSLLSTCISTAIDRFKEHGRAMIGDDLDSRRRLVRQFEDQVTRSGALLLRLDNAEKISIGPNVGEFDECDHCHGPVTGVKIVSGTQVFCSERCKENWEPPDAPGFEGGFADNH